MTTDWKDILAGMASEVPQVPDEPQQEPDTEERPLQKGKLRVVLDKKGRKGKMATIIEGFDISDEEVAKIATMLKQKLAVGGSSRGGEILLQGDCKERVITLLKSQGLKV